MRKRRLRRKIITLALMLLISCVYVYLHKDEIMQQAANQPIISQQTATQQTANTGNDDELTLIEPSPTPASTPQPQAQTQDGFDLSSIPAYSGSPYVSINKGAPFFSKEEITKESFENYSPLDNLGRCGVCTACIGKDIMPKEKREDISSVKPSGWKNAPYDFVDGKYVYNRCHLIGFQLAGENANGRNLITGTRYLNVQGMLPFENMVADYVKETNNHVMYRVTPIYNGNNLVADGVLMEAMSVEDEGDGVLFNVFCYNVQPGVVIDYATGETHLDVSDTSKDGPVETFVANKNSKKFHAPSCENASQISEKNKQVIESSYEGMIRQGFTPCGQCLGNRK